MRFLLRILLSVFTIFYTNANAVSVLPCETLRIASSENKSALGASDVTTIAVEEYVKGNPDTEFSQAWVENRNIIYGSLLVANLTDAAITAYANKAKQMESLGSPVKVCVFKSKKYLCKKILFICHPTNTFRL